MFRKLILAAIALSALSATAAIPTAASAGYWGHKHGHHWRHHHWRPYVAYDDSYGCIVKRRVWTDYGWRWRRVNICY